MTLDESRLQEIWDEVWGLLEKGGSDAAAALALRSLSEAEDVPELHYLLGISLMDLDEVTAALPELERAAELASDWPQARAALGWACFRSCRFEEAQEHVTEAIDGDAELADAYYLAGLLAEREENQERALIAFAEARRLDPERYPEPFELGEDEFLELARSAVREVDPEIRSVLEAAPFFVQPFPSEELLTADEPPLDPQLLGLFVGRSLLEQSVQDSGNLPNTLYLFQKNLERTATTRSDLEEEIRITVLHEIGHHLGWDEEQLAERGLA